MTEIRGAAGPPSRTARVTGVDVARGAALLGMMSVHTFETFDNEGAPTVATVVAGGRSAATFVLLAGVSMAFMSGGRRVVQGRDRTAVAGGLVLRALLIGAIGLALGALGQWNNIEGILPYYAALFLVAVPLLGWAPRALLGVAAAVIVVGPALWVAGIQAPLPYANSAPEPTFTMLVRDPLGLLVELFVTGAYPVVVYLAYICVGLAIGRLDMASRRVAWRLFGTGVTLAVLAQLTSALLLYPLGGLGVLVAQSGSEATAADTANVLLWDETSPTSWWYLALPAAHSHTPVDLVHILGSAMAVLGAALLLTRVPTVARVLSPLAAAGSMILTLYSAHLVLLATGFLQDEPIALYLVMVAGAFAFAWPWRRWVGKGPLERAVAMATGATRRWLADRLARRPVDPGSDRVVGAVRHRTVARTALLLVPVACVAAVALAVSGTRFDQQQEDPLASADEEESAPPSVAGPVPSDPSGPSADAGAVPDLGRFCQLYAQVGDLEDQYSDSPEGLVGAAGPNLDAMPRVAPVEIRDAVDVSIKSIRAEAGDPAVQAPDDAAVDQAEDRIDTFDAEHCP